MTDFIRTLPAWLIGHPWASAGLFVLGLLGFTMLIALNPNGRQVRDLWRKKR